MLKEIKNTLTASPVISDKIVLEMMGRIISSRFPSKFSNETSIEINSGNFHANTDIEKKLKGLVVFINKDNIHYNLASAISDINKPLDGFTNIKDIYSVILKGVILKIAKRNSSALFPTVLNASALLFLDLLQDVVFKGFRSKFSMTGSNLNLAMIILNYFYTTVVNLDKEQARRETENILRNIYKRDLEEIRLSYLTTKQYQFTELSLQDMCLVINDSFGTDLNEKMFHTYFLANHNFMYQGLTNYHEFIAGVYPMLKLGSFSGKLLLTKFSKSTENFIIEFEKGFTTK